MWLCFRLAALSLTPYSLTNEQTCVWKQEWRAVRNGCFADNARMRRSVIVQSTSSSSMMMCFFRTFTANNSDVLLCCASSTCKHERQNVSTGGTVADVDVEGNGVGLPQSRCDKFSLNLTPPAPAHGKTGRCDSRPDGRTAGLRLWKALAHSAIWGPNPDFEISKKISRNPSSAVHLKILYKSLIREQAFPTTAKNV